MKLILVFLIFLFLNANKLDSHELWLEAEEYLIKKNNKLIVNIKVGENLSGEKYPYLSHETEKLFIENNFQIKNVEQINGDYPAIQQSLHGKGGVQYLYYQSNKETIKYTDFKTFLKFIEDYNLSYNYKDKIIPKEIYQRFSKIIFKYDGNKFYPSRNNLDFEIINLNDPYKYDKSKIKIILDGKLFAKKSFIVFFKNSNGFKKKYYKTNIKGIAKIDTKKGGLYLISAVDLKTLNLIDRLKYNANFFSRWASLTFKKY